MLHHQLPWKYADRYCHQIIINAIQGNENWMVDQIRMDIMTSYSHKSNHLSGRSQLLVLFQGGTCFEQNTVPTLRETPLLLLYTKSEVKDDFCNVLQGPLPY